MRGAVSLAAALALPYWLDSGEPFPNRDLIQFVAFGVIFITLVGIGLFLPMVVRALGVADTARDEIIREHEREIAARREALDVGLKSLDAIIEKRDLPDDVVGLLRARHEVRASQLPDSLDPDKHDVSATGTGLTRELIAAERKFIHTLLARRQDHRRDAAADRARPRSRGGEPRQPRISGHAAVAGGTGRAILAAVVAAFVLGRHRC